MLRSRLPRIAAELPHVVDAVVKETAEDVARRAKEKVPVGAPEVHLRDHIHVEEGDMPGEYYVVAGDKEAWYGHIVEHGSIHSAPHPFLVPAGEEAKAEINARGRAAMQELE